MLLSPPPTHKHSVYFLLKAVLRDGIKKHAYLGDHTSIAAHIDSNVNLSFFLSRRRITGYGFFSCRVDGDNWMSWGFLDQ